MSQSFSSSPSGYSQGLSSNTEHIWMHGAAGAIGGSVATMLFYPLDFLRTRLQSIRKGSSAMPLCSVGEIVRQEGIRGMYKGMSVSVVSHSVGWGLYLITFRSAQQGIAGMLGERQNDSIMTRSGLDFASACVAASITGTIVTPLHVIKTRRQLYDAHRFHNGVPEPLLPSGFAGVRTIVRQEGLGAMFRGLGPQILLTGNTTIQVTIYECFRRNWFSNHEDPSTLQVALASAVAKAVSCALFNPLEVVRTCLQDHRNHGSPEFKGMWMGLKSVWRSEGLRGMYRGFPVNVARVIPSTMMSFVLYERFLRVISTTYQVAESMRTARVATPSSCHGVNGGDSRSKIGHDCSNEANDVVGQPQFQ